MIELTTEEPQRNKVHKWRLYWFHESDLDANYPADADSLVKALQANPELKRRVLEQLFERHDCPEGNDPLGCVACANRDLYPALDELERLKQAEESGATEPPAVEPGGPERDGLRGRLVTLRAWLHEMSEKHAVFGRMQDAYADVIGWLDKQSPTSSSRCEKIENITNRRCVREAGHFEDHEFFTSASPAKLGHWSDCSDCVERAGYCAKHPAKLGGVDAAPKRLSQTDPFWGLDSAKRSLRDLRDYSPADSSLSLASYALRDAIEFLLLRCPEAVAVRDARLEKERLQRGGKADG